MTDITSVTIAGLTTEQVAQLCWDNYYKTEATSPNTVDSYIDGGGYDREDTTFGNLTEALYDDIRDLLHNGNQEDLFGTALNGQQADDLAQALHDGWSDDPDPLDLLCDALAALMLEKGARVFD